MISRFSNVTTINPENRQRDGRPAGPVTPPIGRRRPGYGDIIVRNAWRLHAYLGIGSRPDLRADTLAQAGQAWLLAGETERAYAAQTTALGLEPDNLELLIDRSITLARAANYRAAVDDLNRAVRMAPDRSDILVLRANAQRYLDFPETALADVERALSLDPARSHAPRSTAKCRCKNRAHNGPMLAPKKRWI